MFHNYFFLTRFANALNNPLEGTNLIECFSQNKNELVLGFANDSHEYWLKVNLNPSICLIQFLPDFKRAKKNSINLFGEIIGRQVRQIRSFSFERSFVISFEGDFDLVFKMYGSRSNLVLFKNKEPQEVFRHQLPNDKNLSFHDLDKKIPLDFDHFRKGQGDLTSFLPALGKEVKKFLHEQGYQEWSMEEKWNNVIKLIDNLENNPILIINKDGLLPTLTILPSQKSDPVVLKTQDPILAANTLYERYTRTFYLEGEKLQAGRGIENQIKKTTNYLKKTQEKLQAIKNRRSYEELANIIMANLHQITKGAKSVQLFDFYLNKEVDIKLNPDLSPQKNAENLYRKSKNQKIEIDNLEKNINGRKEQLENLQQELANIKATEDFKSLRKFKGGTKKSDDSPLFYHTCHFNGYDILIGKNAKANDQLTLKIATKDDHWLHAKDVSGSHVVIKNKPGKNLPKDVLERGAQLAAWYSKRKFDSLCPVIHTQKKFVRKPKGLPPGAMMVDREKVIMVEPKGI